MPKKQKRTGREVHAMIVRDAKIPLSCRDFEPEFTLHRQTQTPPAIRAPLERSGRET